MHSIPPRLFPVEAPVRDRTDRSPAELAAAAFYALASTPVL
jgi:hypothetical protein